MSNFSLARLLLSFWRNSQANHLIKLYPPGSIPNVLPTTDTDVPVVAETYDEIVFTGRWIWFPSFASNNRMPSFKLLTTFYYYYYLQILPKNFTASSSV